MATFASATDFAVASAPDTMLAAVDNANGAPAVRMDVVRRNLRRLQTREFMSQWNTQKTADAIPIRAHGEHRTCNNERPGERSRLGCTGRCLEVFSVDAARATERGLQSAGVLVSEGVFGVLRARLFGAHVTAG